MAIDLNPSRAAAAAADDLIVLYECRRENGSSAQSAAGWEGRTDGGGKEGTPSNAHLPQIIRV